MIVQFNERQNVSLHEMATRLGTDVSGVLKKALALLQVVLREKKRDNQIGIVSGGKVIKEINYE